MLWIIGAGGMLGKELCRQCKDNKLKFIGTDIEVDITSSEAIHAFLEKQKDQIDWIINCSAYTAVDKAEEEEEKAYAINAAGVGNIAKAAARIGAKVLHISTDYVFPGNVDRELLEDDVTGPVGAYGRTKLEGERQLQENCKEHIIVRTAWLYGRYGKNFVYTMANAMNSREEVRVINDQYGSPTNAVDLADAMLEIVDKAGKNGIENPWGIYHFSGLGECTWYEFAKEIYRGGCNIGVINSDCRVSPCTTAEYPTPASRPAYSLLSKKKITETFGLTIPDWKQSLQNFFKSYIPLQ